ncbi:hypothetical protein A9K55_001487 [Cordyceps militaris]|uniref:Uncharacterized protein n=1 Tax=Cordyceps militaris TaxID=73501 RepID=A0A2H4SSV0_CORMI|nr:hypothetical protein A9K55_001487 [Cordyceps militaris]
MSNQSPWYPCTSFRRRPRQNPQNLRLRRLRSWRATPPDTSVSAPALGSLNPRRPALLQMPQHICAASQPRSARYTAAWPWLCRDRTTATLGAAPAWRSPLRMPCSPLIALVQDEQPIPDVIARVTAMTGLVFMGIGSNRNVLAVK